MQNKALKVGLTATALVVAMVGLLWTTMADGTAYYQHVDEVMVDPGPWYGKRLQVHGYAQDIKVRPKSLDYQFEIENNGYVVRAEYTGIVPDTFQNDAESRGDRTSRGRHLPRRAGTGSWPSVRRSTRRSPRSAVRRLAPRRSRAELRARTDGKVCRGRRRSCGCKSPASDRRTAGPPRYEGVDAGRSASAAESVRGSSKWPH